MRIAILIFDRLTALDAVGPYEVLSRLPNAELSFVAKEPGPKRTDTGALSLIADRAISDLPDPDMVLVPGGEGNRPLMKDPEVIDWLRAAHETTTWTTSVCTGALVLGAAGILEGKRATTHWVYREKLREFGAEPTIARFVEDGKVVTAAGVSAGIDMALHLAHGTWARTSPRGFSWGSNTTPLPPLTPARRRRPLRSSSRSSGASRNPGAVRRR